ncbi:AAA family ATPase [Agromyces aurantiacus]|uniref:AAA family ATPase n=1 Tax=Agromyces aurantiacus TaxID=165814 RepID=A0ABV9R973_9MICO|nr:helix-turn-helix transcriptional regulator [Agromyces aurantiacus]MBM7505402.1 DNA-binding CsgD family transcriptional regulator [Agromyces aurantiacus]
MIGRRREVLALERVLDDARAGRGSALVIEGDPGIGKTALLERAMAAAGDFRTTTGLGVQAERELPFAGLQQIVGGLPDHLDRLPEPQERAIRVALGLAEDPAPSPYLVALAVLGLLAESARDQPVLVAVDDVHWLDGSTVQVLGFVARRLESLRVAMLVVKRLGLDVPHLDSTPVLPVPGLGDEEAAALLDSVAARPLDPAVASRILEEARGNPLLIRESARVSAQIEAGAPMRVADASLPVVSRIEGAFANRSADLPERTALVLLLAAADPTGDPRLVARAAARLGASLDDLVPAEAAGLVQVGRRITFEHPLVRSGVYHDAEPERRRQVHAALSEATDRQRDPDRRAWHAALGTFGPSEQVAAALEHAASRAGARGGFLAAAAFHERAAELAESPETRFRCAIAAAGTLELAGDQPRALRILATAHDEAADPESKARIDLVRGRLTLTLERSEAAVAYFLAAADALAASDLRASREAYLEALSAATVAAPGADGAVIRTVAELAGRAPSAPDGERGAIDELLEVMVALALEPPESGIRRLADHLRRVSDADEDPGDRARWLWVAGRLAAIGWDELRWAAFVEEGAAIARSVGALTALAASLTTGVAHAMLSGDGARGRSLADEAVEIWGGIAIPPAPYGSVAVLAWTGSADAEAAFARALAECDDRGEGMGRPLVHWARAMHAVAHGRYAEALPHAEAGARYPLPIVYSTWALVELVEAAARAGESEAAARAFARLRASTGAAGTDWARGVEARAAALLATEPIEAERRFQEALDHLARTGLRAELARGQLLYGEWLRRQRRRADARVQLARALAVFEAMGAEGFAGRVRAELAALGRTPGGDELGSDALSTQEEAVARLAGEGLSNAAIAMRLHLSASTVDYHLRKAFRKLGISSRSRLHLALSERDAAVAREPRPASEVN